jgi:protein SCO1
MIRRLLLAAAAVVVCGSGLAACTSSDKTDPPSSTGSASGSTLNDQTGTGPYQGLGVEPPQPRPAFTLTDTAGQAFDFGTATAGHPTLLYFGYTNCPDICPETMANVQLALQSLPASLQKITYVVFVTTDVTRDTAAVISEWLAHFSTGTQAQFVGLRGSQAQINLAEATAHIFLATDDGQTHASTVLLFGPDNYARVSFAYNGNSEQAEIAHDLPIVAKT